MNSTPLIKERKLILLGIEEKEKILDMTRESVLNLGRKFVGDDADVTNLYFIQVEVE